MNVFSESFVGVDAGFCDFNLALRGLVAYANDVFIPSFLVHLGLQCIVQREFEKKSIVDGL